MQPLKLFSTKISFIILLAFIFVGCNSTKKVPNGRKLLTNNTILVDDKKDKNEKIIEQLLDKNSAVVLKGIEAARNHGNIKVFPFLLDVVLNHQDETVVHEAKNLVFDTKDIKALPMIMERLTSTSANNRKNILLSAIWEAGFNAEEYLEDIVQMGIEGDYLALVEVLSIVDNVDYELSYELVSDLNLSINEWIEDNFEDEKVPLLQTLAMLLNEKSGN